MRYFILLFSLLVYLSACQSNGESKEASEVSAEANEDAYNSILSEMKGDTSCAYEIKRILNSPGGEFMVTSGYRMCQNEILTSEVIAFDKSEGLGDKESNVFVTEDLRPIEVKWEDDQLVIQIYPDAEILKMEKEVYGTSVIYKKAEKPQP